MSEVVFRAGGGFDVPNATHVEFDADGTPRLDKETEIPLGDATSDPQGTDLLDLARPGDNSARKVTVAALGLAVGGLLPASIEAATATTPPLTTDMLPLARSGDTTARKITVGNFIAAIAPLGGLTGAGVVPFVNGASGPLAQDANFRYVGTVLYAPYLDAITAVRINGNAILTQPDSAFATTFFLGNTAGNGTVTGAHNIGLGLTSMTAITSGADNIGIGFNALKAVTTNSRNIAIGSNAGPALTGADNLVIGANALLTATATQSNVAIGSSALRELAVGTTAGHNVAVGVQAGYDLTTGAGNVFLGVDTGRGFNLTGSNRFISGSYSHPIADVYFGSGEGPGDGSAPVDYTIHGSGANSADTDGADLVLAGGQGCGTGKGGWVVLKYAAAGLTGSTQNALAAGLQVFANNAAAVSGGLPVGALYRSNADPDPVCIVH